MIPALEANLRRGLSVGLSLWIALGGAPLPAGQAPGDLLVEPLGFDCDRGGPGIKVVSEGKPVAGATVHFSLPGFGAGVSFPDGRKVLETTTDANGMAVAKELTRTTETSAADFYLGAVVEWQGRQAATLLQQYLEAKHLCLRSATCDGAKNRAAAVCCAPELVATDQYGVPVPDATVMIQFRSCQTKDGRDAATLQTDPVGKVLSPPLIASKKGGAFEMIATASKASLPKATAKIRQEIVVVPSHPPRWPWILIAGGAAGGALVALRGKDTSGGNPTPTPTPPPTSVSVTFGPAVFGAPR